MPRPRTAWHCCLEFYSVATRLPEEYRLSPRDAVLLLREDILRFVDVVELPSSERVSFLEEAVRDRTAGGRIYDAHIAGIARHRGAKTVVTENARHFRGLDRFSISVLDSSACLSLLP